LMFRLQWRVRASHVQSQLRKAQQKGASNQSSSRLRSDCFQGEISVVGGVLSAVMHLSLTRSSCFTQVQTRFVADVLQASSCPPSSPNILPLRPLLAGSAFSHFCLHTTTPHSPQCMDANHTIMVFCRAPLPIASVPFILLSCPTLYSSCLLLLLLLSSALLIMAIYPVPVEYAHAPVTRRCGCCSGRQ
jgi:hypothetical protein